MTPSKHPSHGTAQDTTAAVDRFMAELRHPFKAEVETLRRAVPSSGLVISDPGTLLKWLGKDRAIVEFRTAKEVDDAIPALQAVLRDWITYV